MGILGCGWLGLPLARHFIEKGHKVSGSTTALEKMEVLKSHGINPYLINLTERKVEGQIETFLSGIDLLIINVPPKLIKNPAADYVKKMQLLHHEIKQSEVSYILFVSSTSVYGDQEGQITEKTPPRPSSESGKQLLASEGLFMEDSTKTTIVRFGGLIGPDRHPIHHLSGKTGLTNGDELINLIHLNDCIHIMETIIENDYWMEVFNGVYPYHPKKKDYYVKEAVRRNLIPPSYITSDKKIRQKTIVCKNFLDKNHSLLTSISA